MTKTYPRNTRNQGGFSLIDVLLALGVVILISGITLTGIRRDNESNQAKAVGEQIKSVGTALNTYVSLRYDTLVTAVPGTDDVGDPGTAPDPGPRTCVCQVGTGSCAAAGNIKMCTITSETLRRNGLLPSNFSGINAFGSAYEYRIRIQPQGGSTVIVDGMVWTEDAYTMEGEERYDLLGQAMMVAGADSGMTRSLATNMEGFNGAWQEDALGVNRLGVLGYRVGYNTFGYAAYLRLNGGEMLGDIDMGDNNIFNIETLKTESLGADTIKVKTGSNRIVFRDDFDTTTTDGMTADAATATGLGTTAAGGLSVRSDTPVQFTRSDGVGANVQMGDLAANNAAILQGITANNITLGTGTTPATSGGISAQGTIITTNLIRGSTVTAGSHTGVFGVNSYATMYNDTNGGGIYFNTNSVGGGGTIGFKLNSSTSTITMGTANLEMTGGIRAAGTTGTQGIITADRRVLAGANLTLDGTTTPTLGSACTASQALAGTIMKSSGGVLVQCITENTGAGSVNAWRALANSVSAITTATSAITCTGAGSLPGTAVTALCPVNSVAISGGFRYASGAMRAAPQDSYRVPPNGWAIRPGPTQAYTGSETQTTCWRAEVVCSY